MLDKSNAVSPVVHAPADLRDTVMEFLGAVFGAKEPWGVRAAAGEALQNLEGYSECLAPGCTCPECAAWDLEHAAPAA